ncbi:alpha-ribazole phosphatase [Acetivibrio saccincola]|jgi:alpha-ribazole phosphatase|uniref:Alpha-ribazole phosphatase n=1 Tax=Acetivibrio saccincola TaxID=1677857 RepID=A0A2K9E3N7_9FIRM|nr:alpha-ribazole phosphatase [Acetivibrio saccincola]AUG58347.1 Alpha-ribazole phosphatase [Acetivibrio saccincola]NLW27144.1 alpha-ribazole phosphatase [Acetivibrio saccincola]PQQ66434.1 alpha-ribazole phosphatase [Acetivibrio saccincola]HOA96990.1 alpha-ribazole phosphatase [Acetivibrio saccincola]HQD27913.1 alpha-ribazole phosphatase [Acetivibrio saccincola]
MLELILIRHGQTDSNKRRTYVGWTDVELNEEGIRQARNLKEKLKNLSVDKIYSSPLKRARKTAEIINENFNLDIHYDNNLKERNFGIWDDLTDDEIKKLNEKEYNAWQKDWKNYPVKGGESGMDSYERVIKFTENILNSFDSGRILIVSHLGTIRFMLSYLLGMGIEGSWRFRLDNCEMAKIQVTDGYGILTSLGK